MSILTETFTLENGIQIPKVGFGTWQIPGGKTAYDAVVSALKTGYRHVDTAQAYANESSVGKAIKDSGIKRENIFVTSKLPAEIKTYDGALAAFDKTMDNLGLKYLDLYLIHAPCHGVKLGPTMTVIMLRLGKPWKKFIKVAVLKQLVSLILMSMI